MDEELAVTTIKGSDLEEEATRSRRWSRRCSEVDGGEISQSRSQLKPKVKTRDEDASNVICKI